MFGQGGLKLIRCFRRDFLSSQDDVTESDASQLTVTPRNDDDVNLTPQPQREHLKPFRRLETLNAPSFDGKDIRLMIVLSANKIFKSPSIDCKVLY